MKTIRQEYKDLMSGLSAENRRDTEKIFTCGVILGIEIMTKDSTDEETVRGYLLEAQDTLRMEEAHG